MTYTGSPSKRCICAGTNTSMGGPGGGMRRGRKHACPVCGKQVAARPGRAGRLYPHSPAPRKNTGEDG